MSHHQHSIDHTTGSDHGTYKSYIVGLALSLIFTILSFGGVYYDVLSKTGLYVAITIFALAQLYVQLFFFLHLNTKSESRWNLVAFLFSLVIVLILVFGSIWIMVNLDYNMMH
ncbi:cytochrome o ubiquinol oxidase subunit IV [Thiotrichales bacterium 19S9-12]|nr:cytochrome o ubiquinol oxidase subunit IV [Thiotrichales bacterium 19S9-11]MCF6811799.1 cytochrome o ubiquinol oxidase subunit IV [Thiotrichales bacterium 19S9-12]